jgi:hypothetical protein
MYLSERQTAFKDLVSVMRDTDHDFVDRRLLLIDARGGTVNIPMAVADGSGRRNATAFVSKLNGDC